MDDMSTAMNGVLTSGDCAALKGRLEHREMLPRELTEDL
jgi:hypothetical protein